MRSDHESRLLNQFTTNVHRYVAYGGILESELSFPELPAAAADAAGSHRWRLLVGREPVPDLDGAVRAGERLTGAEAYVLWTSTQGFRLEYSHAGVFDVDVDRAEVTWYPRANENVELARAILIGPVAALLLEAMGDICLHGSAVLAADGAIAFVAPKRHGKSTLALALTAAGCRLMSDDLVAITGDDPPLMRPAVPTVRLWGDAATQLRPEALCDTRIPGIKHTLGHFHGDRIANDAALLSAIYVLIPQRGSEGGVRRARLGGAEAAIALAQQKKLADTLIGYGDAASRLPRAAALAAAVAVYKLHVPRDFAALPGVVEQIIGWHGAATSGMTPVRVVVEQG